LDPEMTDRLLEALRTAELVTLPTPSELAVVLQNTNVDGARAVERRLRKILLDAEFGLATREPDDGAASLL
jgi:GGDEF domain-containing protein